MSTPRLIYVLHSWTGLVCGWLLFTVCLTGALVVYKFPLKALANPTLVAAPLEDRIGPDGALAAFRIERPQWQPRVVAFPSDIFSIHHYTVVAMTADGERNRFWIDPATARISERLESDFADFVLTLHRNLFLGQPGRWFVGLLGLFMLVSLVSGVWFHWRRLRRDLFHLRLREHARKAWGDLHKLLGVWLLPFHLIIALTGAWLGIESLIGLRASDANPIELLGAGPGDPQPIAEIVETARLLRPDFRATHVNMTNYGAAGATIRVQGDLPGYRLVQRGQTMLVFDADSGRHLQTVDRLEQGVGRRVLAMVRPLHYGYFWPFWGELLYFVLGIGTTVLTLSGMLIWADRDRRRAPRKHKDAPTWMERANVAVMGGLLVALAGIAVANALARSIGADGLDFLGSRNLLSSEPAAPELILFFSLWVGFGAGLAALHPLKAWVTAVSLTSAMLVVLPVTGAIGAGSLADYVARGAGEATGYALACFLLALSGACTVRRLARHPSTQEPDRCLTTA
ncbi:MAG: PepSY domain-containing protein [Gammaproteobacteria bacterium]|nr:PepSY domain-containing protein [Gammaproteobacteria bacterium]TVQ43785.1 MAG: PepSY domain-containing protein [Gammaproteobacteria bacterium]